MIAALLLLSLLPGKRKEIWRKIGAYILPIALLLIAVNRLLGETMGVGLSYALRFVLLMTPMVIIVYSIPASQISLALRTSALPARLQYLFIFSFEAVQSLRGMFQSVLIAQQLPGLRLDRSFARRWKNIFPLLFPVILTAVSQGMDRGLALEFKGIESRGPKTHLHTLPLRRADKLSIGLLLILSCFVILVSTLQK